MSGPAPASSRWLSRWLRACRTAGLFLVDAPTRSQVLTELRYGKRYYQHRHFTAFNRYPLVFRACQEYLSGRPVSRALSFGCSTGEEVATIGSYFPDATVIGVDINGWCLRQARKRFRDPRFSFLQRFSPEFAAARDFDLVFCLAVFQSERDRAVGDGRTVKGFLFEQFERDVLDLDRRLKPGGLFILDNADFSFLDVSCARNYAVLPFARSLIERQRPRFDRENRRVGEVNRGFRVFVKGP